MGDDEVTNNGEAIELASRVCVFLNKKKLNFQLLCDGGTRVCGERTGFSLL